MRARALFLALATASWVVACGWDPSHPFERDAPPVKAAIGALDAGDAQGAASLLEGYLTTGECKDGNIGTPEAVKSKGHGSLDLGLALFQLGEAFGARFGDEEKDAGLNADQRAARSAQIDCALRVVQAIADDARTPLDLRARARYLEGNLRFTSGDYEAAVGAYDKALALAPGMSDAGDPMGRDAAWNRAIAQRRIEDKKDAGQDASSDSGPGDGASDAPSEGGGGDGGGEGGGNGQPDSGGDGGSQPDSGGDSGPPPPNQDDASAPPPPPSRSQDDRILDQLEHAPTVQEEAAKRQAKRRVVRGMADK